MYSCSHYLVDVEAIQSWTVGWFLSEIIRQLRVKFGDRPFCKQFSFRHIVGLKLRNGTELLDFRLTQYERLMPPLKAEDELEVLFSGRFCSLSPSDSQRGRRVPQLSDFEVVKVIGKGGFSKVLQVRKRSTAMRYA